MSFFTKYGNPQSIKPSKSSSAKDLLLQGIDRQLELANGKNILTKKGMPIKSWFKGGRFKPLIGIYSLFGDGSVAYTNGREKEMLEDLKHAANNGELDAYFKDIDNKRSSASISRTIR